MLPSFATPFELLTISPVLLILIILVHALFYVLLTPQTAEGILSVRRACLEGSLMALAVGLTMALTFDKAAVGYQFTVSFGEVAEYNTAFAIGVDGLSYVFLVLTLFTFPFLFLAA